MAKVKNTFHGATHLISSFFIAVVFHLVIVVLVVEFSQKNPYLTTFSPESLFPVQLSESPESTRQVASSSTPLKRVLKKSGALTGVALNKVDTNRPLNLSADGAGDEVGQITIQGALYPKIAQQLGHEGVVTLRLKITPEGVPIEPIILKSSGYESLDQAALETALRWRFTKRSKPDFLLVDKTIVYKLNKQ